MENAHEMRNNNIRSRITDNIKRFKENIDYIDNWVTQNNLLRKQKIFIFYQSVDMQNSLKLWILIKHGKFMIN